MEDLKFYLAAAVLVAIAFAISNYFAEKRRKEFKEEAERLGMLYASGHEFAAARLPHPLFSLGHARDVSNVVNGGAGGVPVSVFDYQYVTGSGKNSSTYRQSVAAFELALELPHFEMFPERYYHRLAELVGHEDIDFPEEAAFSAAYRLLGKNVPAVRGLFGRPGVAAALAANPGWTVEGAGRTLIVYRTNKRISPRDLEEFLAETLKVARAFTAG